MIVLAGKNNIAVNALNFICNKLEKQEVLVVCNKNDNRRHGWQRSLGKTAEERCVKVISLEEAYNFPVDVFISLEFDRIIRPERFSTKNIYNIHFSELPKYKGMYTSVWPILNNEDTSGVTLHKIDSGIDTGGIISQVKFEINDGDRSRDLYRNYLKYSFQLFADSFESIMAGCMPCRDQESKGGSYYSSDSIDFNSIKINLNKTAWEIRKQVYAFSFREYQLPMLFGRSVVEVLVLGDRSKFRPGTVVFEDPEYVDVATIDYNVRIFFDGIHKLSSFASCKINEVDGLINGLCGVNDRNNNGWSPIIVASYNGNIDVVERLLSLGADVNDVNYNGTSVLMYAKDFCIKAQDSMLFKYLIERGADVNHRDFNGKTVIDYMSASQIDFLGI